MDRLHRIQQVKPAQPNANVEQRIPMTYTEFLEGFEDSTHAEWIRGEAIVFMPPTIRHQDIVIFLVALLGAFVRIFSLGKILVAPCEMRLTITDTSRQPDILFIANANLGRVSDKRIEGPADLVIEVISNESVARDRGDKFYEYQENGVREYWVIDPRPGKLRADFWVLNENGSYRPVPIGAESMYLSTVLPNFKLNVSELLTDETLDPVQALIDMVGIDALTRTRDRNE